MRSPVGAITNSVRISASPVSTWVGGTCGVPIALRRIDSTTATRTKQVVISSANGTSDSAAIARMTTSGRFMPWARAGGRGRARARRRTRPSDARRGRGGVGHGGAVDLGEQRHRPVADADQEAAARGLDQVDRAARLERAAREDLDRARRPPHAAAREQAQREVRQHADHAQRRQRHRHRPPPERRQRPAESPMSALSPRRRPASTERGSRKARPCPQRTAGCADAGSGRAAKLRRRRRRSTASRGSRGTPGSRRRLRAMRSMKRTPMPGRAVEAVQQRVLANPAHLGVHADRRGRAGQRELQLDVVADAAQLVRGDEETAGADVLGEAGVEVVVTLEVDLDLEVESLRDSSPLLSVFLALAQRLNS